MRAEPLNVSVPSNRVPDSMRTGGGRAPHGSSEPSAECAASALCRSITASAISSPAPRAGPKPMAPGRDRGRRSRRRRTSFRDSEDRGGRGFSAHSGEFDPPGATLSCRFDERICGDEARRERKRNPSSTTRRWIRRLGIGDPLLDPPPSGSGGAYSECVEVSEC